MKVSSVITAVATSTIESTLATLAAEQEAAENDAAYADLPTWAELDAADGERERSLRSKPVPGVRSHRRRALKL